MCVDSSNRTNVQLSVFQIQIFFVNVKDETFNDSIRIDEKLTHKSETIWKQHCNNDDDDYNKVRNITNNGNLSVLL